MPNPYLTLTQGGLEYTGCLVRVPGTGAEVGLGSCICDEFLGASAH